MRKLEILLFLSTVLTISKCCDPSCDTCDGGSSTDCLSCNGNYLSLPPKGSCSNTCPEGYYPDDGTGQCLQCFQGSGPIYYSCATCLTGGSSTCKSCYPGYFLSSSFQGPCLQICPDGFWGNPVSSTCELCYFGFGPNYTCLSCEGTSSSHCTSCQADKYLLLTSSTTGRCVLTCPDGYWPDDTTKKCLPCYSSSTGPYLSCKTCSAGGNSDCLSCNSGYFLSPSTGGYCAPCPAGSWGDTSTQTCQPCYSSTTGPSFTCATCSAGGANNCLSCSNGAFLHLSECISTCPAGYWGDASNNACKPCYSSSAGSYASCATCISGDSKGCTSCYSNTFLYPSTSGYCLFKCPSGYWGDDSSKTCQSCSNNTGGSSSCAVSVEYEAPALLKTSGTATLTASVVAAEAFHGSNTAAGMFVVNLLLCLSAVESIANMQYLNINHSSIALDAYSGLSSALIPNWISRFNKLENSQLEFHYGVFEKIQISSLYLDNYGDSLTEKMVYCGVFLVALTASAFKQNGALPNSRIGKFYAIAFGLFLSNVFGQLQSQLLFSIVQILKIDLLIDPYSRASYFMAYFTLSSTIGLQILSFFKLITIYRNKNKKNQNESPKPQNSNLSSSAQTDLKNTLKAQWTEQKYKMLFESFKEDSKNRFFFSYWMTAFNTVYILSILILQPVPVIQCLSTVIITLVFILFSAVVKPMNEKSTTLIYFYNFGCILVIAILNMVLAIRDSVNPQVSNDDLGKGIYYVIMSNTGINLIYGLGGTLLQIYSFLAKLRKECKKAEDEVSAIKNKPKKREKSKESSNPRMSSVQETNIKMNDTKIIDISAGKGSEVTDGTRHDSIGTHHRNSVINKGKARAHKPRNLEFRFPYSENQRSGASHQTPQMLFKPSLRRNKPKPQNVSSQATDLSYIQEL